MTSSALAFASRCPQCIPLSFLPKTSAVPSLRLSPRLFSPRLFSTSMPRLENGRAPNPFSASAFRRDRNAGGEDPFANTPIAKPPSQIWPSLTQSGPPQSAMGVASSRVVYTEDGRINTSLKRLRRLVMNNAVRKQDMMGKRYEKPHDKRYRLRSQRHRRRFAAEVGKYVILAKRLKEKGV